MMVGVVSSVDDEEIVWVRVWWWCGRRRKKGRKEGKRRKSDLDPFV